jgi:hypothetical protein
MKELQETKKEVRALIDAGVETSASITKHLKVQVGISGQGGGMSGMKHIAMTLERPGAVRIFLLKY